MCKLKKEIIEEGNHVHGLRIEILEELDKEFHIVNGNHKPKNFADLIEGAVC